MFVNAPNRDYGVDTKDRATEVGITKGDLCIDLLFLINVLGCGVSSFIDGNYKYVALFSLLFFLSLFSYQRKHDKLNIGSFREICPVLINLFGLYIGASSLWAIDRGITFHRFIQYEEGALVFTCFYVYYRNTGFVYKRVITTLVCAGILFSFFIILFVGIDKIQEYSSVNQRLQIQDASGKAVANVNGVAEIAVYSSVLLLCLAFKQFRIWHLSLILLLMLIFVSGSRKGLASILLFSFTITVSNLFIQKNVKRIIWVFIVGLCLICVLVYFFKSDYSKVVMNRVEGAQNGEDESYNVRVDMIDLGWEIFFDSPFVGCGIDCPQIINGRILNFYAYLHNNPMELLAGGGIIGFLLYYSRFWVTSIMIWRLFRKSEKTSEVTDELVVCIGLLGALLVYEVGSVTYYGTPFLFYSLPLYVFYGNNREKFFENQYVKSYPQKYLSSLVPKKRRSSIQLFLWRLPSKITLNKLEKNNR